MKHYERGQGQALRILIFYEGPFDRMACWLWRVKSTEPPTKKEVLDGSFRDRLACICDRLDLRWRFYYASRGKTPHPRWKRRIDPLGRDKP